MVQLTLRLVRQLHDLLGAAAQQHPVLRQHHPVLTAAKQFDAQLLLQLHQLAGEGRLRHMEQRRRFCDILLPCHSEKIAQDTQFHTITSGKA